MIRNPIPNLEAEQAEVILRQQLGGRVRELHVVLGSEGVVLQGSAVSYYAKQLAQHFAHKLIGRPVLANEIAVSGVPPASGEDDER
jgi:hypothetical protein